MPQTRFIHTIEPLLDHYDGFLLDQWGVLHNGARVFPGVLPALERLRAADKTVVLLTNSGKRADANRRLLSRLGVAAALYKTVLSSGEAAWLGLKHRHIAPFDRTDFGRCCLFFSRSGKADGVLAGLDIRVTDRPLAADFVLLSGLPAADDAVERIKTLLAQAGERGLPLLCTNPDLSMIDGGRLVPGPGRLASDYADAGGKVYYIGKPWPPVYQLALTELGLPKARVVAVGDSLDHDIRGARDSGLDSVLIADGVHREAFTGIADADTDAYPAALARLLNDQRPTPTWLLARFQ